LDCPTPSAVDSTGTCHVAVRLSQCSWVERLAAAVWFLVGLGPGLSGGQVYGMFSLCVSAPF
jgi:hypothetical protein